jgi:hypothetical protein
MSLGPSAPSFTEPEVAIDVIVVEDRSAALVALDLNPP